MSVVDPYVLQLYPSMLPDSAVFARLERKTATGMLPQPPKKAAAGDPVAVKTRRPRGRSSRGRSKSIATGLRRTRGHFDCLSTLREEHQRITRIKAKGTDGCATRRFIAHPYQSSRAAVVAELLAAKEWINRVRRRKRLRCRSPGALTAGAHPRW